MKHLHLQWQAALAIASRSVMVAILCAALSACGGGGGGSSATEPSLAIASQPADVSVTVGTTATFRIALTGSGNIQWQTFSNNTWVDIGGANGVELNLNNPSAADDGRQFRATIRATGASAYSLTSSIVTLKVKSTDVAPSITAQPADLTLRQGQSGSISVTATGTSLSYVWQVSRDGLTWNQLPAAIDANLVFNLASTRDSGQIFRVVISNALGSQISRSVTLSVLPALQAPSFTSSPVDQTVTTAQTAVFTATCFGEPLPNLQWQSSIDGQQWIDLPSETRATLVLNNVGISDNGRYVRAVASNSEGTTISSVARLVVNEIPAAPYFRSEPADAISILPNAVELASSVSGAPAPNYQWQVSSDQGASFTNINGATAATLRLASTSADDDGKLFRLVASNELGTVISRAAHLSVQSVPQILVQPADATGGMFNLALGSEATVAISASGGSLQYTWQVSTDGGSTFSDFISGNSQLSWYPKEECWVRVRVSNAAGVVYSQIAHIKKANWKFLSPSFTGLPLSDVAWLDDNVVVAVGRDDLAIRSTDAGLTWNVVKQSLIYAAGPAFVVAIDDHTLIGTGLGGVSRSTDAGLTWSYKPVPMRDPSSTFVGRASFRNASIGMAVIDGGGLLRTVDGGDNWTLVDFPLANGERLVDIALRGQLGVMLSNQRAWRSTDGGATWTATGTNALGSENAQVTFVDDSTVMVSATLVQRSIDGGQTWFSVNLAPDASSDLNRSAVHFLVNGRDGITQDGRYRSTDGGQSWVDQHVSAVVAYGTKLSPSGVAIAVGWRGEITRSADLGLSWTIQDRSIPVLREPNWQGVAFTSDGIGLISGFAYNSGNGLSRMVRSTDGGNSWLSVDVSNLPNTELRSIAFADRQVAVVVGAGLLARSSDSGQHWSAITNVPLWSDPTAIAFADSNTGFVLSERCLWRSNDGGITWTEALAYPVIGTNPIGYFVSLAVRDKLALVAGTLGILRSTDGGLTWTVVPGTPAGYVSAIAWIDSHSALATISNVVYRSNDSGLTWTRLFEFELGVPMPSSISFSSDGKLGFIATMMTIYRTSDGGLTWQPDWSELWFGGGDFRTITPITATSAIVVGDGGLVAVGTGY
ncbi:YCF48-related protein [Paucibacter sp. R3-3]|uniref:YCF48-related protein n=1 Tax=Roseateles agri TaxID=3098619 RepID=A0ABU5DIQ5_9BURK|nr:YCF48-related protein [Paucibacter sp. R3-3]MDY0746188.1 YCF48-related protein [Paucibacter sp. R3-3]